LKADGCDINKELKETTRLQWSGDVDLGDGALQKRFQSYKLHLQKVNKLSARIKSAAEDLRVVLSSVYSGRYAHAACMKIPIIKIFNRTNNEYSEKLHSSRQNEKEMMLLAWKVKELSEINETSKQDSLPEDNIPRQLSVTKQKLETFIKAVMRHRHTAATHILVFMISTEA